MGFNGREQEGKIEIDQVEGKKKARKLPQT